jgi:trans-2,3-dihydro-3-hydroxyanthranilate isomerase
VTTSKLTFHIVDVFAEKPFAGNQLAVVRGGQSLSDVEMQAIAREMHFSETTFLLAESPREGGYDVRIFTPEAEVPFAGHPTLGTAHIIRTEICCGNPERLVVNLKVGQIPVTHRGGTQGAGLYWMDQIEPAFGKVLPREAVAPVLGLPDDDIDARFPIEEVSTGLPTLIVPLRSLAAVRRARIATDRYFALVEGAWARPILVFAPEARRPGNHASVRVFAPCFGIPEDPATGSSNGCLAAYLVRHRFLGGERIDVRVEQGWEINRPSLLHLQSAEAAGHIRVSVGGQAITVARGEFCL